MKFFCKVCVSLDGNYNYFAVFNRLQGYPCSTRKQSEAAAENELLLLETYQSNVLPKSAIKLEDAPGQSDEVSCEILNMFQPALLNQYSPREIAGDGNCLFRSISLGLYASQSYHLHLRLLTVVELMKHQDVYDINSKSYKDFLRDSRIITSDYKTLVNLAMRPESYSETMHVYALSAAINIPIMVYCPPQSLFQSVFTRLVTGRDVTRTREPPVTIMLTQLFVPENYAEFAPRKFCLLYPTSREKHVLDLSLNISSLNTNVSSLAKRGSENASDIVTDGHVSQESEDEEIPICSSGVKLTHGQFLDVYGIVNALTTSDNIHTEIPDGIKENVYFVVLNEKNIVRHQKGKKSTFSDDCGIWNGKVGTSPKTVYSVINEKCFKILHVKDGLYCMEKTVNKKRNYTPLEPQPERGTLLEIQRYYTSLKKDPTYKKRVSWIKCAPSKLPVNLDCAIVEYVGAYPGLSSHGNMKKKKR